MVYMRIVRVFDYRGAVLLTLIAIVGHHVFIQKGVHAKYMFS